MVEKATLDAANKKMARATTKKISRVNVRPCNSEKITAAVATNQTNIWEGANMIAKKNVTNRNLEKEVSRKPQSCTILIITKIKQRRRSCL